VSYTATILAHAFSDAEDEHLIAKNPAPRKRKGRTQVQAKRDMVVWTPAELATFLGCVQADERSDARHVALFRVLAMCGVRRSEALGLRWSDVSFDTSELTVRQRLVRSEKVTSVDEPKTSRGTRTIDVDEQTVAALRAWKARQGEERMRVGPGWNVELGPLVFTRADGSHMVPNAVGQTFDRIVGASGLPKIRLHDLRHTHASHLLSAGAHPALVSARLGHASAGFTLGVYAHVMPGQQKDAANAVAKLVGS